MTFLMRVRLPDVPGSLGRVATAIGEAGGDIVAIEIVAKHHAGTAIDDVLLDVPQGVLTDAIVSRVNQLDDVSVEWMSWYAAGGNLFMDLEVVESLTEHAEDAMARLVALLPVTFRAAWGGCYGWSPEGGRLLHGSPGAPDLIAWADLDRPDRLPAHREDLVMCATPADRDQILVIARVGGPDFLESELARFGHLTNLARTIAAAGGATVS